MFVLFNLFSNLLYLDVTWCGCRCLYKPVNCFFIYIYVPERCGPLFASCGSDPVEVHFVWRTHQNNPVELTYFLCKILVSPCCTWATVSQTCMRPNQGFIFALSWYGHLGLAKIVIKLLVELCRIRTVPRACMLRKSDQSLHLLYSW